MRKSLWTLAGYDRLRMRIGKLELKQASITTDMVGDRGGENSIGDDRLADIIALTPTRDADLKLLDDARRLMLRIVPAPVPTQTETIQVGHRVEIEYLDPTSRRERGDREAFIVGGHGEVDDAEPLRTYSCDSLLVKALIMKSVGDTVEIKPPSGVIYEVEICSISIPEYSALTADAA